MSRRFLRGAFLLAAGIAVSAGTPRPATAQAATGVVGAAGGLVAGTYTMTAIYVTKARFGHFLFSLDDALAPTPEILPLVAGPIAGAWLGAESGTALWRALGWGSVGFVGGAAVGVTVGHMIWGDDEGRWAGAIIGSAAGMLAGAVLGARDVLHESPEGGASPTPVLSISIPLGGGR